MHLFISFFVVNFVRKICYIFLSINFELSGTPGHSISYFMHIKNLLNPSLYNDLVWSSKYDSKLRCFKYCGFRLFASHICQRKYCNKAVSPITRKLHSDQKSDWTSDADDCFVPLTDVQQWNLNHFYFFEKWITFTFFFTYQVHKVPGNNPRSWHRLAWTLRTNSMKICFEAYLQLPVVQQLLHVYLYFQFFTNMIMCISPLQPQLATCALVKLIDKFCAMS